MIDTEAQEINAEIDRITERRKLKNQFLVGGVIFFIAVFSAVIALKINPLVCIIAYVPMIIHSILDFSIRGDQRKLVERIWAYKRTQAVPLYHDMLEAFGDKYHVHLEDTGSITFRKLDDLKDLHKNIRGEQ